jgi:protein-L-isoaspartate(D-aspartate) O-methyltransferase
MTMQAQRDEMMRLLARHIRDPRVLDAMRAVPREAFVPEPLRRFAYADRALPIGEGQTISQPLIVAMMTEALALGPEDRVLEVGTGSGYQAAILSQLARDVITVERVPSLIEHARGALAQLGRDNVRVFEAGETLGRPEAAPYDAILVAAGAPHVPRALIAQLTQRGRLVVPVGGRREQQLVRARNTPHGVELARLGACAFVPLIGRGAWDDDKGDRASRRISVG